MALHQPFAFFQIKSKIFALILLPTTFLLLLLILTLTLIVCHLPELLSF